MSDYTQMWSGPGLDLKAHDALLSIPGGAYRDIFLSRKDRPEGMRYFDFVVGEVHGLRIGELLDAKAEGRKVVDVVLRACRSSNMESIGLGESVRQKHGLPFLEVVTDYSQSDVGRIRTRVEALLEMCRQ